MIINFKKGAQIYQLLVAAILDFFKMTTSQNEGIYFVSYLFIHMKYFDGSGVLCDVFCGKGIWIWCSADNNISSWWIVLRSGSKIRLKKIQFSVRFLVVKSHFSNRQSMKVFFLKSSFIWMHITRSTTYYLLPWPPHWIIKMANHDMCDEKCHPSQLWMLQFFLKTSHIFKQQNIRERFDTRVNIRGGHAPVHHDLHTRFSKWQLALAYPSNWKFLEVQQGHFVYFS